jgi:hypothetical protein
MEGSMDPWPSAVVIDTSLAAASVNLERALSELAPG